MTLASRSHVILENKLSHLGQVRVRYLWTFFFKFATTIPPSTIYPRYLQLGVASASQSFLIFSMNQKFLFFQICLEALNHIIKY